MKIHQETAILLEVVDLQERDRIVGFLTAEGGRRRGAARGARTKFSRFAGSLQPLAKVELTWVEKEGRELVRVEDAELVRPAAPFQTELEGILLGAYLAESITAFTLEGDPAPTFYRLLDSTLEALLGGAGPQPLRPLLRGLDAAPLGPPAGAPRVPALRPPLRPRGRFPRGGGGDRLRRMRARPSGRCRWGRPSSISCAARAAKISRRWRRPPGRRRLWPASRTCSGGSAAATSSRSCAATR